MDNVEVGTRVLVRLEAIDLAYATVTAIDHDQHRDFYHLSVAGINEYFCTSGQVVRVLAEGEFRGRYDGADPDRGRVVRHPDKGTPAAPYVGAAQFGDLTARGW